MSSSYSIWSLLETSVQHLSCCRIVISYNLTQSTECKTHLIPVQYHMLKNNFQGSKDFHNPAYPDMLYLLWPYALPCLFFIGCSSYTAWFLKVKASWLLVMSGATNTGTQCRSPEHSDIHQHHHEIPIACMCDLIWNALSPPDREGKRILYEYCRWTVTVYFTALHPMFSCQKIKEFLRFQKCIHVMEEFIFAMAQIKHHQRKNILTWLSLVSRH